MPTAAPAATLGPLPSARKGWRGIDLAGVLSAIRHSPIKAAFRVALAGFVIFVLLLPISFKVAAVWAGLMCLVAFAMFVVVFVWSWWIMFYYAGFQRTVSVMLVCAASAALGIILRDFRVLKLVSSCFFSLLVLAMTLEYWYKLREPFWVSVIAAGMFLGAGLSPLGAGVGLICFRLHQVAQQHDAGGPPPQAQPRRQSSPVAAKRRSDRPRRPAALVADNRHSERSEQPDFQRSNPFPNSRRLVGIVHLEILNYSGHGDPTAAAKRALRPIGWADTESIRVDLAAKQMDIGVRVMRLNTALAKEALKRAGFETGRSSFATIR